MIQSNLDADLFDDLRKRVNAAPPGESGCVDFYAEVEAAFGFSHFPQKLKSSIHSLAYDRGHSSGHSEVVNEYFDILEMVNATIQAYQE